MQFFYVQVKAAREILKLDTCLQTESQNRDSKLGCSLENKILLKDCLANLYCNRAIVPFALNFNHSEDTLIVSSIDMIMFVAI